METHARGRCWCRAGELGLLDRPRGGTRQEGEILGLLLDPCRGCRPSRGRSGCRVAADLVGSGLGRSRRCSDGVAAIVVARPGLSSLLLHAGSELELGCWLRGGDPGGGPGLLWLLGLVARLWWLAEEERGAAARERRGCCCHGLLRQWRERRRVGGD